MARDLPFVDGRPAGLGGRGWALVIGAVVAGALLLVLLPPSGFPLDFVPVLLFTGLPLGALAAVAGDGWTGLFRRYGLRQLAQSLGFAVLAIAVSVVVALLLRAFVPMAPNPSVGLLAAMGPAEAAAFLTRTFIQLIGEELTTILPLLAMVWLGVARLHWDRRVALGIAVAGSTAWFCALHLPTYDWNLLQCFGAIGAARLVLTGAFLLTRNLWVSAGAHIANDWTEFAIAYLGGHVPIEGGGA